MSQLGASWIDDVSRVIATLIPRYSNIDLGTEQWPFRNLWLSGGQNVLGDIRAHGFDLLDESPLNYSLSVYASGTAYQLTNSSAALNFSGTDPIITINKAGTYLIRASVKLDYTGATFAASRTVTLKLRRTNNTAADVSNSTITLGTEIVTTQTSVFEVLSLPDVIYTTSNITDTLTIFGDVSVAPSAGSLDASAASIVAIRIA